MYVKFYVRECTLHVVQPIYLLRVAENQLFVIFVSPQLPFPPDGIRYQDQEQRYVLQAGNGRVRVHFHIIVMSFIWNLVIPTPSD